MKTEKSHNGFRLVFEYGEDILTRIEKLVSFGEVVNVALA
jgi:hypothetical protein